MNETLNFTFLHMCVDSRTWICYAIRSVHCVENTCVRVSVSQCFVITRQCVCEMCVGWLLVCPMSFVSFL